MQYVRLLLLMCILRIFVVLVGTFVGPERAPSSLASPPTGIVTEDWGRKGTWSAGAMAMEGLSGEGELRTGGRHGSKVKSRC